MTDTPALGEIRIIGARNFSARLVLAVADLKDAARLWRLWSMLGWADIRQRYRRSFIGPFWITISMAVMVGGMGLVYGTLFHQDLSTFLPFIGAGFLGWFFVSTCIGEGALPFVQAEGLIKQGGLPLSLHVFRVIWRNVLILCHNAVVIIVIYLWFGGFHPLSVIMVVPGLVLTAVNVAWINLIIGPLCTRFRDLAPIIANMLQMLFFITPVVFLPQALSSRAWIVELNPLY